RPTVGSRCGLTRWGGVPPRRRHAARTPQPSRTYLRRDGFGSYEAASLPAWPVSGDHVGAGFVDVVIRKVRDKFVGDGSGALQFNIQIGIGERFGCATAPFHNDH